LRVSLGKGFQERADKMLDWRRLQHRSPPGTIYRGVYTALLSPTLINSFHTRQPGFVRRSRPLTLGTLDFRILLFRPRGRMVDSTGRMVPS
jgi:hypothetical protein